MINRFNKINKEKMKKFNTPSKKYKITYEDDDIQKVYDAYNMDEVLIMLLNIKTKYYSLIKIEAKSI